MERIMHTWLPVKIFISVAVIVAAVFFFFGPPGGDKEPKVFVVPKTGMFDAAGQLKELGYVRSGWLARLVLTGETIEPGGYTLKKDMWLWQVTRTVTDKPSLLWVTITGCLRREQIGELLQKTLSWDQAKLDGWNDAYKTMEPDYIEGGYYPDTYLIPADETGAQVAKRFLDRFNEKFAPYAQKFLDADIRWVTALKIASLIEREAAGAADMKLISGIIWNRLNTDMRLEIDATMQYTRGKKADGSWWGGVDLGEKNSDSPYNTYRVKGLPPTPICSPSITSIEAVLAPEETDCLYYLHDKSRQIHCAATYAEHKENIVQYLQ
jgi:UPF0755 protein